MKLRDAMRSDAARVFLNTDEFAEEITIEGVTTPAVCDWSVQPGGEHLYGNAGDTWGVNAVHAEITLAEGIILQPEPGDELVINNRAWLVSFAAPADGLLNLKLFRNVA